MGVVVASAVAKAGSDVNGVWGRIVVVKTNPGYDPVPGTRGRARSSPASARRSCGGVGMRPPPPTRLVGEEFAEAVTRVSASRLWMRSTRRLRAR